MKKGMVVLNGRSGGGGGHIQGPTNIFDKTCPWASGMQKALARQDELVVQYHV